VRIGVHYIAFWSIFELCRILPLEILDFCGYIRKILMKALKSVHHIKHYTLFTQTCQMSTISFHYTLSAQTCQMSTISFHYTLSTQTCQNCVHKQMSTISITTLCLHKHAKCPLCLCKHAKIASISKCPPYQSLYFVYTNMPNVHYIISLHLITQTCQNFHHINHYTLSTQTCQNCVHKQMSTISITALLLHKHVKIASTSKCPLYQSLHFAHANMPKLRP
jgi:hypothetical protein